MKIKNIIAGILFCILITPQNKYSSYIQNKNIKEFIRESEGDKKNNKYWFIGTINTTTIQRLEPYLESKANNISYKGDQIIFYYINKDWVSIQNHYNGYYYNTYIQSDFVDIDINSIIKKNI